ncbi:MAG: hypothetical protein KF734_20445 [Saprospiraceae bacterium]|nr:hypothetical protein [Saprospiraceae bacterium]
MEEKTLWERIKRKFENSPLGVFILGFLLLTSVAYNWYSNYKTEQKNNRSEKIEEKIDETNKELLAINNLLIKHMRFRVSAPPI